MKTTIPRTPVATGLIIAAVALTSLADTPGFEEQTMTTQRSDEAADNKTLVRTSFERWRDGTGSPFELLADDVRWTIVGRSAAAGTYAGRESFMTEVIDPFNARMQVGLKPQVRHIYADGSTVIVFFDARSVATDGMPYQNTYAWILDMDQGRISNATAFFDSIEFDDLWRRVEPGE